MANTPNLDLEEPVHGSANWDTPLNSNFSKIDAGVVVKAPVADQTITGAFNLNVTSGSVNVSGDGVATQFGAPTLLDLNATSTTPWNLTMRQQNAASGEGLTALVDANGDVFLSNTASNGTIVNHIILRGVGNSSYIRFGPDQNNGIAVGIGSPALVTLDGTIYANSINGGGIKFGSIGGGNVILKPASFATDIPTQLLPDADGTVGIKVAVPSTATSAGVLGMWAADDSFAYFCTGTSKWRRVAVAAW